MHPMISRRQGLTLAAAAAALLPLREAVAQTRGEAGRDWLAMIQQHHGLIAKSFEQLLAENEASYEKVNLQLRTLEQLQHAHSLAEESVIYPAMARMGMGGEAEKLYMDEAHIKIAKAQVQLTASARQGNGAWRQHAQELRGMLLKHAKEDEEGRLFPLLKQKLNAAQNRELAAAYARTFGSVVPVNR